MEDRSIELSLSGGGFRAALFHLGVIRCLRKVRAGEIPLWSKISTISSVSGGSVLAAHLVLDWSSFSGTDEEDDKAFDASSLKFINLVRSNVRDRILRKWVMARLTIFPSLFSNRDNKWGLTKLLEKEYSVLFKDRAIINLPDSPTLLIQAASMNTGDTFCFSKQGITRYRKDVRWYSDLTALDRSFGKAELTPLSQLRVAFAVAASSAFPPLFPPVLTDHNTIGCDKTEFPGSELLTDGGVSDNLGIHLLVANSKSTDHEDPFRREGMSSSVILMSDAGGFFDHTDEETYVFPLSRNIRASDMLMRCVSSQTIAAYKGRDDIHRISIDIANRKPESVLDVDTCRALRAVRTDLDAFTPKEIQALVALGYAQTREKLLELGMSVPHFQWSLIEGLDPWPPTFNRKDQRRSRLHKLRPIGRDVASLVSVSALVLYLAAALGYFVVVPRLYEFYLEQRKQTLDNQVNPSGYLGTSSKKIVVIFIPGSLDTEPAWMCSEKNEDWPTLLRSDSHFNNVDIFRVKPSAGIPYSGKSIDDLEREVYDQIEPVILAHEKVLFVTYGVGGNILQAIILDNSKPPAQDREPTPLQTILLDKRQRASRFSVVNYGVPFEGVSIGWALRSSFRSPGSTFTQPNWTSEDTQEKWHQLGIETHCAYETSREYGVLLAVGASSATAACVDEDSTKPIKANHDDIARPCAIDSTAYSFLSEVLRKFEL